VSVYLDASILVSFFVNDSMSQRADALIRGVSAPLLVSDFAAAESASALGRRVRMGRIGRDDAKATLIDLDAWIGWAANAIDVEPADISAASAFLRRLDLNLRTPDAIHIAMTQRVDAELATFDERMAECARALGATVRAA
jgi:predicted nucleic acid-binding protein